MDLLDKMNDALDYIRRRRLSMTDELQLPDHLFQLFRYSFCGKQIRLRALAAMNLSFFYGKWKAGKMRNRLPGRFWKDSASR